MWKLLIEDDEGKRHVVPLTREEYSVGRQEGNTIRLTERNISRRHIRFRRRNGPASGFAVDDLESYNGVFVNGLRVIGSQDLIHGDLVQVGDYRIVVQDDAVQDVSSAQTQPGFDAKATAPMVPATRGTLLMERPNRLVVLVGPTPGLEFALDRDRMTIGRSDEAYISVNHNSVSRIHCEVHALGDGRFEIVDKGSSNGVRVNGSDLRRGIIEAGDLIELGDVQFKFVGAGQVFVAGPGESQRLTAITDREVGASGGRRGALGLIPFMLLGAVVAAGAVGAFWFVKLRNPPAEISPPGDVASAPHPAPDPLAEVLAGAHAACSPKECEGAHATVTTSIPEASPLRNDKRFAEIEAIWADAVLAAARAEPDRDARRAMLERVLRAATVDEARRAAAKADLDALAEPEPEPEPDRNAPPDATNAPTRTAPRPAPPHGPHPKASSSAAAPKAPEPDLEKLRAMMTSPSQVAVVRRTLEPRVLSGKASPQEVDLLRSACKAQYDTACLERIAKR